MSRSAVPAALKRRLFEEAGYRCAVPTCRGTSALQMEHIEDWSKVQEHDFENMIVLCATCHVRVTSGEISKAAIRNYKNNLAIISGRYSLYEMRLFEVFRPLVDDPNAHYQIAKNDLLHVKGVVDDGLFQIIEPKGNVSIGNMVISPVYLKLTDSGRKFIRHLMAGRAIE